MTTTITTRMKQLTCPKANGKACEDACVEYLMESLPDLTVLSNVYINHQSSRPKYENKNGKNNRGNVIWSNIDRDSLCSELDAVIVQDDTILQVWEAKHSLSPSTFWDVVSKKGQAMQGLWHDDPRAELTWTDPHNNETRTAWFPTDHQRITLGVAGMELMAASNAVGQLRAMAMAQLISHNVDAVVEAVEHGYMQVEISTMEEFLDVLAAAIQEIEKDFHIRAVLVNR